MKKGKFSEDSTGRITPRARVNSNYSSTNSIKKKFPINSDSKQKENNKENQTNNTTLLHKRKLSKDENPVTSLHGFKNIKAKVAQPKKAKVTIPDKNNTKSYNITSGKSTPRVISRQSSKETFTSMSYGIKQKMIEKKITIGQFKLGRKLHQTSFSTSFQAMHIESRLICCLKIFQKKVIKDQYLEDQLISEIKIRSRIAHPNILKIYGFFADEINFYIIEEFILSETIQREICEKRKLSEKQAGIISKQIVDLLKYLHSEEIIHRDLRNKNISRSFGLLKVIDFSWIVSLSKKSQRDTFCGSFRHVPPELLQGQSYDQSIDIWNLGVIMYEMVTGLNPFCSETLTSLDSLTFPIFLSNQIVDMLGRVLVDRCKRMSLNEIENHEWMKKNQINGLVCKEFWNFWR